jgi:hypothetical protein
MSQLRTTAHHMACDVPGDDEPKKGKSRYTLPKDYDKRLKAALKKLEPEFKKLERRLKKCPKPKKALLTKKPKTKKKRAAPVAPAAPTKPVNGSKQKKGLAASILDGDDSTGPMSREGALTEGVAQDASASILDFLQGSLD